MLLFGDAPLDKIELDTLGVREFAVKIAQSMLAQGMNHGLVFGLEGIWGSGKSTLKNEIFHQISSLSECSDSPKPIIVHFDPWILRGVQPLVGALLEEIKASIIQAGLESNSIIEKANGGFRFAANKASEYREAIIAFSEFSGALAETIVPGPNTGSVGRALTAGAKLIPKRSDDPSLSVPSLRQDKERVNKSICALNRPIIISIDDIDRLDPEEIMEVMRLVRSVADFPNTIYLLNYDPRIVAQAAEKIHGVVGSRNYLDKIVNIPIRVPVPEAFDLRAWFETEFLKILQDWHLKYGFPQFNDDENDFHGAVSSAGNLFLRTPRDVRRALDAVRLTLGSLKRRLWPADLAWISIIKIGSTELHGWIERYLTEMANIAANDARATNIDVLRFDFQLGEIAKGLELEKPHLRSFLGERLGSITANEPKPTPKQSTEFNFEKRGLFDQKVSKSLVSITKFRKLASPYDYKFYFTFQSPITAISDDDEERFISCLHKGVEATRDFLIQIDNIRVGFLPSKLQHLFRYLMLQEAIPLTPSQRHVFLRALIKIIDDPKRFEEIKYMEGQRGWIEAAGMLPILFPATDNDESRAEIAEIYQSGEAISWLTFSVHESQSARRNGNSEKLLKDWQFETVKEAILLRYSQMNLEELLLTGRPSENFYGWRILAKPEVTHSFILKHSESETGLLSCLELLRGTATSAGWSKLDPPKTRYFVSKESLQTFFKALPIMSRLEKLRDESGDEELASRAKAMLEAIDGASQFGR